MYRQRIGAVSFGWTLWSAEMSKACSQDVSLSLGLLIERQELYACIANTVKPRRIVVSGVVSRWDLFGVEDLLYEHSGHRLDWGCSS